MGTIESNAGWWGGGGGEALRCTYIPTRAIHKISKLPYNDPGTLCPSSRGVPLV